MLKTLFNLIVLVGALLLLYSVYESVSIPGSFEISVSRKLTASPESVFDLVNDTARFPQWEPWSKADKSARVSLDGPSTGQGAIFQWASKRRGTVTLRWASADRPRMVGYSVDVNDYGGRYEMDFLIVRDPVDEHLVDLTWVLRGKRKTLEKPFWYFFNLDETIRRDFAAGLYNINETLISK